MQPFGRRGNATGGGHYNKRRTPLQYKGVLNLQTNIFSLGFLEGWVIKVELEGIEPSSKRGMNTLSTCLSLIGIVGDRCADRATNNHPLAYEVLECCPIDLAAPSPDICASPNSSNFGARVSGDVSSEPIGSRMKLTYYSSVRQRERNYFRQLKILKSDIKVREQQLTTCLLTPSSRCQSQSAPCVLSQEKNYCALIL